jgi:hypothetical protein
MLACPPFWFKSRLLPGRSCIIFFVRQKDVGPAIGGERKRSARLTLQGAPVYTRIRPRILCALPRAFGRAVQGDACRCCGVIRPEADAAKGPPDAAQNK